MCIYDILVIFDQSWKKKKERKKERKKVRKKEEDRKVL